MNSNLQNPESDRWVGFARAVYATRDNEISCDQAAIQMARRFSTALTEAQARQVYPDLFFHFQFCSDCVAEYKLLMELAEMEAAGQFAQQRQIPPRPDKGTIVETISDVIEYFFGGFVLPSPQAAGSRVRGSRLGIAPVKTQLTPQLSLTLDVDQSESNTNLRSIMCTIEQDGSEELATFEGIMLQLEDANGQMVEETVDGFGSALFDLIASGTYQLHFKLSAQPYVIRNITVP